MKRVLTILLCAFLLVFPACKKEVEEPPAAEKGVLYTTNGLTQNTLVSMVLKEEDLVAPVTESISFEVYNNTTYTLYSSEKVALYKWQDDKWERVNGDRASLTQGWTPSKASFPCSANSYIGDSPEERTLEAGLYYAAVPMAFAKADGGEEFEAVAFFTIASSSGS